MTASLELNERTADAFARYYRILAISLLLATAVLGAGALDVGGLEMAEFALDSEETEAEAYIDEHFTTGDAPTTLIVVEGPNTLTRESLLTTLALQNEIRENETVAPTLADDQPTAGVENAMAIAWDPTYGLSEDGMSLEFKKTTVESFSESEHNAYLSRAIHLDDLLPDEVPKASTALPRDYERGDTQAESRLVVVVHDEAATEEELLEAQLAIEELADEHVEDETFVFAEALTFDRGAQVTGENFGLIGPLAAVLVAGVLFVAYRDPLDVLFALFGMTTVLVWLLGFLGWTGIGLNQLLIAVPCLLIGLSVDHALHVLMRYREARQGVDDPTAAMATGLVGVGVALVVTTLTTVVGFLSGLVSPVGLLREFGVVAAFGIVATFLVFAGLLPALKLEADRHLESWGVSRSRRPIGRRPAVKRPLKGVSRVVQSAPVVVVVVAFLLATGGVVGLAGIETDSERTDFLPREQPAWAASVPGEPLSSGYPLQEQAQFVDDTFAWEDQSELEVLIRGDVTDRRTHALIAESEAVAEEELPVASHGDNVYTPAEELRGLSFVHDEVDTVYEEGESGVPESDLEALYDAAYEVDPEAANRVLHRTDDGEYVAVRVVVDLDEEATIDGPDDVEAVLAPFDDHPDLEATATGTPVVETVHDRAVVETVFGTFLLALTVVVGTFVVVFRIRGGSWLLGAIVATPVLVALSWAVLTMRALEVPLTTEVAIIAGIGIGIGVDYAVHVVERYRRERREAGPGAALDRTIVDTGGTLLASAATTALGFGALLLSVVPSLQRFGLVTVLVVTYSFLAAVLVLPSVLYLWDSPEREFPRRR